MAIEIKYADELVSPYVHVFLLGDTGSGKTRIAASWPYPIFILPKNEQSIVTLRGCFNASGGRIPYIEVSSTQEMNEAINFLEQSFARAQQFHRAGDQMNAWNAFPYQTVVIESISHYGDLIIEDLTGGEGAVYINGHAVQAKGKGTGLHQMDQQKWGLLGSHLRNIHARLRNLPVHTIFTSLAQVKESDKGVVSGGALISGAMATKLPSACDIIGYCEQQVGTPPVYRTYFRKYKQFTARMRLPLGVQGPEYVDSLTWDKIKGLFGYQ